MKVEFTFVCVMLDVGNVAPKKFSVYIQAWGYNSRAQIPFF
jgi:hypothetical protein